MAGKRDENNPGVCQVQGCDSNRIVGRHKATGVYACESCRKRYAVYGEFKRVRQPPMPTAATGKCDNQCGHDGDLRRIRALGVSVCAKCLSYYHRHGSLPNLTQNAKKKAAQLALCECGKNATHEVEMTGASMINTYGFWREQKWTEHMCDDCLNAENQLRAWQPPNVYEPSSYIKRG